MRTHEHFSYHLNMSGQTICAHFYGDGGWANVRNVATVCNVHLVRAKP